MSPQQETNVPQIERPAPLKAPQSASHHLLFLSLAAAIGLGGYVFTGAAPAHRGDEVSAAQATLMASNFAHATGSLMPIDNFAPERQDELAAALRLRPAEAANLMLLIESGKRSIGWLSLWDNFDEDGDVVSVTSAGFTQIVPLIHEPKRIMVVYVPSEPIYVTGERDGVGGITVAVELTTGPLPLPIMAVGQTVALPVQ